MVELNCWGTEHVSFADLKDQVNRLVLLNELLRA